MGLAGNRTAGSGFTSALLGTGLYAIDFPAGTWLASTFPVVVVTPSLGTTYPLVKVDSVTLTGGAARVVVSVSSTAGAATPANHGFSFVAVQP